MKIYLYLFCLYLFFFYKIMFKTHFFDFVRALVLKYTIQKQRGIVWNVLQSLMLILPSGGEVKEYTRVLKSMFNMNHYGSQHNQWTNAKYPLHYDNCWMKTTQHSLFNKHWNHSLSWCFITSFRLQYCIKTMAYHLCVIMGIVWYLSFDTYNKIRNTFNKRKESFQMLNFV